MNPVAAVLWGDDAVLIKHSRICVLVEPVVFHRIQEAGTWTIVVILPIAAAPVKPPIKTAERGTAIVNWLVH